jgi:cytosine/adenosine deaminase-related metal-dependent hydrolase
MFVNAHTHLYSGLAPLGMPPPAEAPRDFVENLEKIWWRLDRALDEASLRAGARYYVAHARRAGTVALVDHHESPNFIEGALDVLADGCAELGMAAVLCYGATERNGGEDEARRGLDECRRFILANRRPRVAGVVGLHASFTVSDGTIRRAGALCRDLGTVLHVHLAEDRADVDDARRRGYAGPLQRLLALDAVVPGSILVHGVHLAEDEVRRASDAGCWFVQNPRSNRKNRVGYPSALIAASRVALGTDGFPADMPEEAGALAECSAAAGEPPEAVADRPEAGWALVQERLRLSRAELEAGAAPEPVGGSIDAIEGQAREQAARLWTRW